MYKFIVIFVQTTNHLARNNGGAARQENNPQSATKIYTKRQTVVGGNYEIKIKSNQLEYNLYLH